ncbi:MAG TPA: L-alanine-DL-glutamate epimerase [Flavitalea sp.]|nr:L-alanine-DL-glutamate epimerase [Flavitalea sp.]
MDRRQFIKNAGLTAAFGNIDISGFPSPAKDKLINVVSTDSNFEREKLARPFGFKGGYLTELWQVASKMQSAEGRSAIGLCTQSVLYGDADLFTRYSENGGNALMYALTDKILALVKKTPFRDPIELLEKILPRVAEEGKQITGKDDLNVNFVYNALISVDNAAWLLYAAENGYKTFDAMTPAPYKKALSHRNDKIAIMYQVPYKMTPEDLTRAAEQGFYVFKIKGGFPGSQSEMLEGDMAKLTEVHTALKNFRTPHTANGKLIYTLDPNARYEKKETLARYLDHAKKIGAFDQMLLIEEPFVETNNEDVRDLGVRMVADESVHVEADAIKRFEQGYGGLALKGIAKSLSLSMRMAKLAYERDQPCLCADLTVNPILIDWNKNLAARLKPFPGIGAGLMETNGDMNYRDWKRMEGYHPRNGASWTQRRDGVFELNDDFYKASGGIFEPSVHYQEMFAPRV